MSSFDVIGFGALNVDRLYRVDHIAKEDEESFVTDFKESCGGSAANTMVGLARLGLTTGYTGKVANDRGGDLLLDNFSREGVDTDKVVVAKHGRSGIVTGFVDKKGERALYIDPGVNDELKFYEIDIDYARQARFLHLTSFVGERPFRHQARLVKEISNGVKISFDPGVLYAKRGLDALKPIIKRTFVILPSERELKLIVGESHEKGAEILIKEGVNIVAVKLGENGCYVTDGGESHLVDPFKVEVIDTTGAGDAFSAGFLYGLVKGKDLRECGKIGNFVASRCIMRSGSREGLPTQQELEKLLH